MNLISFLLDRTGSMSGLKSETIEGYNDYLEKSYKNKNTLFALTQFDSGGFDLVHDFVNPEEAIRLSDENFQPRGMTPLYDAIAHTVAWTEKRAKELQGKKKSKPSVLVTILTDGYENSSTEHSLESINTLIKRKEAEDGWTFMYIGAAKEAWNAADAIFAGAVSGQNVYRSSGASGRGAAFAAAAFSTSAYVASAPSAGGQTQTIVTPEDAEAVKNQSE